MFDYISNLFSDVPHGFLFMFVALAALSIVFALIKKAIEIVLSVAGTIVLVVLIAGALDIALKEPIRAVKETVEPIVCEVQNFFDGHSEE